MGIGNEFSARLDELHDPGKFCQAVMKQIDVGLTSAMTALNEVAKGNTDFGIRAAHIADRIHRGLNDHLDDPNLGESRQQLIEKLDQLGRLLGALREEYGGAMDARSTSC